MVLAPSPVPFSFDFATICLLPLCWHNRRRVDGKQLLFFSLLIVWFILFFHILFSLLLRNNSSISTRCHVSLKARLKHAKYNFSNSLSMSVMASGRRESDAPQILETPDLLQTLELHKSDVNWCAFDGNTLATCSADKTVRLWR